MKSKKLFGPAIVLLALLMMLVSSLAGCECSASTASFSDPTMCLSVDPQSQKPVEKADVFAPDTPVIYCSVKLSNAPPDTEVKAQWIYKSTGKVVYEDVGTESGTYYLSFSLQPPQSGWPIGDYEIKFFIDGNAKLTVPFSVGSGQAAPVTPGGGAYYLTKATMCLSVDPQTKQPIEKANVFSPDTPEIICSVLLVEAPAGTKVTSVWVYVQGELKDVKNYKLDEATVTTDTDSAAGEGKYLSFPCTRPDKGWPRGDYAVSLRLNGEEKFTVSFKVQ